MRKQVRVNESTLIKVTETYKRVEGFRGDINSTIVVEEVLLKYIEDNK